MRQNKKLLPSKNNLFSNFYPNLYIYSMKKSVGQRIIRKSGDLAFHTERVILPRMTTPAYRSADATLFARETRILLRKTSREED